MKSLGKFENHAYAMLRIVAGFMFLFHGTQKVLGFLGDTKPMWTQMWVGGVIELVGGTLIMIGLMTRFSAFICSGMMAVAYFQVHWPTFALDESFFPIINKGELAALYCFVFLYISCRGGVKWCLDKN